MKAPFSAYLSGIKPGLRKLLGLLGPDYDYVSILATDSKGLTVRISRHARSVGSETMTTERGVVVRVSKNGQYSEYALNGFDPEKPEEAAREIREAIEAQKNGDWEGYGKYINQLEGYLTKLASESGAGNGAADTGDAAAANASGE